MSSLRRRHSQTSLNPKVRPAPYPLAKHRSHSNALTEPGDRPRVMAADDDEVASSVFERSPEPEPALDLSDDDEPEASGRA